MSLGRASAGAPRVGASVKFCGITRPDDAALAARLGARYVGAIFAGGPRLVDAARARAVFDAARAEPRPVDGADPLAPLAVGVFGTQAVDEIAAIADAAALDVVQLHADPDAAAVEAARRATHRTIWAVLRVRGAALPPQAAELFAVADAVLLDPKVDGALGGTGHTLPWGALIEALAPHRERAPLVLAGGLTPDNVAEAAALVGPAVVDVSSGVEVAPGLKDPARMAAFVRAVAGASPRPSSHAAAPAAALPL